MTIAFYGAARTVTGSKHLLSLQNGKRILLDCGMFQGRHQRIQELNLEFGFSPDSVDYLMLSHAHIDHSGLIPRLVKLGFSGRIFCTPPTLELCRLVLYDSAHIQESGNGNEDVVQSTEPLYSSEDVENCLSLFETVPYNQDYQVDDEISFRFTDVGHILGSAAISLTIHENNDSIRICFSGDIGRYQNRILRSPQPIPQADILICESTYGNKLHESIENTEERLLDIVRHTVLEKKGKLLIPAFSIGRTQELVFSLNVLAEDGRLPPEVNVFVDSPMSVYATDVMREHAECFNKEMKKYLDFDPDPFGFPHLKFITETDESKLLDRFEDPCVIISSSGMMEGGRIRHHLRSTLEDTRNTLLVTGYCEPATLGGKIVAGAEKVNLFGEELEVNAEVIQLNEYSAHGDYEDVARFLIGQDKDQVKQVFLVHGEEKAMEKMKSDLESLGFRNIYLPGFRMNYEIPFGNKIKERKRA